MAKSSSLSLSTVLCWVKLVYECCTWSFICVSSSVLSGILFDTPRTCSVRAATKFVANKNNSFFLYYVVSSCMLLTIKKESFQELLEEDKVFKERYCSVHWSGLGALIRILFFRVMEQARERLGNITTKIDSGLLGSFGDEFVLPIVTNMLSSVKRRIAEICRNLRRF